jgi:2-polyprenyl-6-methoxyphenol hydroxylase-like FAD-dependent oxidoreductase
MDTDVLIIGAGPFGLAVAAQAAHEGIEHIVTGKPMEFWRRNMPKGMFLRSACVRVGSATPRSGSRRCSLVAQALESYVRSGALVVGQ